MHRPAPSRPARAARRPDERRPHAGRPAGAPARRSGSPSPTSATLVDVDTIDDAGTVAAAAPGTRFARRVRRAAGRRVSLLEDDEPLTLDLARWAIPITRADESVLALRGRPRARHRLRAGPPRPRAGAPRRPGHRPRRRARGDPPRARPRHARPGGLGLRRRARRRAPGRRALLLDGSVGIGGAPRRACCAASRELLAPGGVALVEGEPPGTPSRALRAEVQAFGRRGEAFPWALVGSQDLPALGARAGLETTREWSDDGRWFAALSPRRPDRRRPRRSAAARPRHGR